MNDTKHKSRRRAIGDDQVGAHWATGGRVKLEQPNSLGPEYLGTAVGGFISTIYIHVYKYVYK